MYEEEVLTGRTTQADIDDSYTTMLVCEDCGNEVEPPDPDYDEEMTCGAMDRF